MDTGGVYQIINRMDPTKFYVGSTYSFRHRRSVHQCAFLKSRHPNIHLQRAYDLHGLELFSFVPMIACDPEEALRIEQELLTRLRPHYNISLQAGAPMRGRKHSHETRQKLSRLGTGRANSAVTRLKLSKSLMGHAVSAETRRKIGKANSGKKRSAEVRRRMGEARMGRSKSPEHRRKISEANRREWARPDGRRSKLAKAILEAK